MHWLMLVLLRLLPATQQPIDSEWALALPLSPGAVALLVENPSDPRALERLSEALAHSQPEIRAAAARVVYVSNVTPLLPDAEAALTKETEPVAASELMWVVAALGGVSKAGLVVEAATRLGMANHAGDVLATTQQHLALRQLESLRADSRFELAPFLSLASRADFASLGARMAVALREEDDELWAGYLGAARTNGVAPDPGPLTFGLGTSNEAMRFESIAYLVVDSSPGAELPPLVRDALATLLANRDDVGDGSEAFLLELLARARGSEVRESESSLTVLEARDPGLLAAISRNYPVALLTDRERRTLGKVLRDDEKAFDEIAKNYRGNATASSRPANTAVPTEPMLTTVGGFPRGLVSDLVEVTGCKPERNAGMTIADTSYAMDGRRLVTSFHAINDSPSDGCAPVGRALVLLDLHRLDGRSGRTAGWDRLVVWNTPEFLSCLEPGDSSPAVASIDGEDMSKLRPPKKTKDVSPTYPESARNERVQGVVILDSIITLGGCVQDIRTLRSVDERLSFAAVYAVSQWQYEPSIVDGALVSVQMMVTVNFALR